MKERNLHRVQLSNGSVLLIEECKNRISLATGSPNGVDMYIASIDANGVLVYPNSGYAPDELTRGLCPTPITDTEESA
jgi:hypothetical protein